MAGFRIGRGRDNNRTSRQQPQQATPYGNAAPPPPYASGRQPGQQQWPPAHQGHPGGQGGQGAHGGQPYGEPEYFGDPYPHQQQQPPQHDPYAANHPGHTRAFSIHDEQYAAAGGYQEGYGDGATYQAGAAPAPVGPRLHWKQLLSGMVTRPGPTFFQMRDHAVWGPAVVVTFLYGLLALFGFDEAREEAISATLSTAVPYVLLTGVMFVVGGLILGAVTHTLARQLGGDGAWQPTVGLSMLIMALTDAPRLVFALFLGGDNTLVQILGWLSWLAAGALFTSMVSKSHDLPWPKALGASSIQLIALLSLIKLGTI
ncbi:Yip1 family protein [Streptomyces sp. ODS05-4]|uniref:Yip1 family protein n=1 Tax=Streptomyces sp. ODS05-4 TaxID=2944939 RepID=UPI00210B0C96|nr:Yip1 family protein [Streptomyces sp. ODS05-4]